MTRCIDSDPTFFISTRSTLTPHGSVTASMFCWMMLGLPPALSAPRRVTSMVARRIDDPVPHDRVHLDRHIVLGDGLLLLDRGGVGAQVHGRLPLDDGMIQ
jgi:hypothetical protein